MYMTERWGGKKSNMQWHDIRSVPEPPFLICVELRKYITNTFANYAPPK